MMEKRPSADPWIRTSPTDCAPLAKLVCFHHGGGGASSFNSWQRLLPPFIQVLRVQLPGREDRMDQPPFATIEALVPALAPHLESLFDCPVAFYGHSLGAIVAFEAARSCRRSNLRGPVALFVSGRRAPQLPLSHPAYCLASDEEFIAYLRTMGGTPEAVFGKPHWREKLFPTIRADLKISDLYTYQPEPPLGCPIVFFAASDDHLVSPGERRAWAEQTAAEFDYILLDGGHFFRISEQELLISHIRNFIIHRLCDPTAPDRNCELGPSQELAR